MTIKELVSFLNKTIPPRLQEEYDNAGLIVGSSDQEITGVLVAVDVTEKVIDEAVEKNVNFILAHHPLIFSGLKSLTGEDHIERTIIKAIKNDIAVFSAHTNLDNLYNGVNFKIAEKIGLDEVEILRPRKNALVKLAFFVPHDQADKVREAVFEAGAGEIGDYDSCSYNLQGEGTFRAGEGADPYVGEKGELHFEAETRVEAIFPAYLTNEVVSKMIEAHPYEEVAYDLYPLLNEDKESGPGVVGNLKQPLSVDDFLKMLKDTFSTEGIRYTNFKEHNVKKVAICGGSGSFLLKDAIRKNADAFITADFKYHQFFDADGKILITDIGHYESEEVTKEIFYEILRENFHNFAVHLSKVNTNPINYY